MNIHQELYDESVKLCKKFLKVNRLDLPRFVTYEECEANHIKAANCSEEVYKAAHHDVRLVRMISGGSTVGMATGFYHKHPNHGWTVYVNLGKTAPPVFSPGERRWSYPCWKTDRTAMGVVAHEVGHHVSQLVSERFSHEERAALRDKWQTAARGKKVSSYEPNLEESAAETLRLFILNPTLLQAGIPKRYNYLVNELGLKPSEKRHWRELLKVPDTSGMMARQMSNRVQPYIEAAERWAE